jgi:DNA-binding NarL/FixJ family response regulator
MSPVTVLIADDHRLFRDGLRGLLEREGDFKVVAETADGAETVATAARLRPDVVLMDISMPGLNGIEAARRIVALDPGTRVVMLSMHADRRFVTESLRAGATGYLLKDCDFSEVLRAVQAVTAGTIYLGSRVSESVLREYVAVAKSLDASAFSVLSPREREVLQRVAEGKSTKETAGLLRVSVKTIETHRKQIMDKLGLHTVAELTKYAIREGITPVE